MFLILRSISSRCADIMRTIFVTCVQPIVDYAAILWFPYVFYNVVHIERIQRIHPLYCWFLTFIVCSKTFCLSSRNFICKR